MQKLIFTDEIKYKLLWYKKERSSCQISFAEPLLLLCIIMKIMQNDLAIDLGQKWWAVC